VPDFPNLATVGNLYVNPVLPRYGEVDYGPPYYGSGCDTAFTPNAFALHSNAMRRGLAIVLALLFSSLLILPAFASSNSTMPVCCRKEGKHRCMMHRAEPIGSGASVATIAAKCPCAAQATVAWQPQFSPSTIRQAIFAGLVSHPAVAPQTEASYRVSYDRSRQKRGPPSTVLA
jgi:hypothetical protein